MLRVLETFQPAFLERVDADHLSTALYGLTQRFKHAWVVGAGVLTEYENRVGMFEIVEGHGAFTDAHALRQRDTAGFVAHVRAVGKVIGAVSAHEQLIQIRRFVAGPAGGIELGHVRAWQVVQVLGDQGEGVVPGNRLVTIGFGVIDHWLGQTALIFQPVVTLLQQRADAVAGEKGRIDAALGGFPVDRLGAVLTELDHAAFRRVAPGAARAVEAAILVGLEHGANIFQRIVTGQPEMGHADQRTPSTGRAFIRLVARG